jgi:hypothetical protein
MDKQQISHIVHLQEASRHNRLVAFVGAGVSKNSGIPMWHELIKAFKDELPENLRWETDDLKMAQMYKDSRGHKEYMDKVKAVLKYNQAITNDIHRAILSLNPVHIITTNYDDLLEQEIQNEYKQFAVIRQDKDMPYMTYPNTLVKMHGDYDTDNIVLTENDYYDYSRNFPLIRSFVLSLFASKVVVFIGFSFADLNLKMILNELKDNLSENMPRIYLLSTDKPDGVTSKYFDSKGINIVYFEDAAISKLFKSLENKPEYSLSEDKGIYLFKLLSIIRAYKQQNDLIDELYSRLMSYRDEIRVFGNGLKHFIPNSELKIWNAHSEGLQLFSPYFKNLKEQLKSFAGKKQFIRDHKQINRTELKRIAYQNYLYRVDDVCIIDKYFINHIDKYFTKPAHSYLEDFDFDGFNNRLKLLSTRHLTCSIDDLEYPFALCKVGDYYHAYLQYKQILPLAWNRKKYILYFICLYNLWSIGGCISMQLCLSPQLNVHAISREINALNINEALSKLPIDNEIRLLFQDLISSSLFSSELVKIEDLKEKLHKQRMSSENGGCSMNSNIVLLEAKFVRQYQFANNNYIVSYLTDYYKSISRNTVIGVLNSFETIDNPWRNNPEVFSNTKIDNLDESELKILLFSIDNGQLKDIISQYRISQLTFEDTAITYLNNCINNLAKHRCNPYVSHDIYFNQLKNLILIVSKITDCKNVDMEALYDVIAHHLKTRNSSFNLDKNISALIEKVAPSVDKAKELLIECLSESDSNDYQNCLIKLSGRLHDSNEVWKDFKMSAISEYQKAADSIYPLYTILPPEIQPEFDKFCIENITHIIYYIGYVIHNGLDVDCDVFEKLLSKYKFDKMAKNDATLCSNLVKMGQNEAYSNIASIVQRLVGDNLCYKFFKDPLNFDNPEAVQVEWIRQCSPEVKEELMTQPQYRKIVKDRLSKLLKNKHLEESWINYYIQIL